MVVMNWSHYANFDRPEFECSHTGKCEMHPEFMGLLQAIRIDYQKPMIITSGYRDATHPEEAHKDRPGTHTHGIAADIAVRGVGAIEIIQIAAHHGVKRIGVNQKGDNRFIHLDVADRIYSFPEALWSY